ncbi:hypothetical protein LCGC14_2106610 [marine sediment metagenome]|uniref:Uncharacterized protein n=1 Tax=marine sediment metagenome TaxID=412755 RepID=A0A0F9GLJ9_9ZZZZ
MKLTDYEYRRLLGLIGEERIWWQQQLRLKPDDRDVQRRVDVETTHLQIIEDKLITNQEDTTQ